MNPDPDIGNRPVEILVVEDSLTQSLLLQMILEKNGYKVSCARDGNAALQFLEGRQPALVISDIQMPGMDGYKLCHAIKSDARCKSLPVILLTSLSAPQDIIHGLECGADNFVVKPYEAAFLLSRIEAIRENQRLRMNDPNSGGIPIYFDGKEYLITSDRRQILSLLLSTYETAIQTNHELTRAHECLKEAQAQLIEAEKLQSLGRLASGVAHEIRNPLAIIEMAAAVLLDHVREEDRPILGEVSEAVRRATTVIDSLIDLSSPRGMGMTPACVREVVERALAPVAAQFQVTRIELLRDYDAEECMVRLDIPKIEQALANVLTNARDAMPDGGRLEVKTRVRTLDAADAIFNAGNRSGDRLRAGDRVVTIGIADDGGGIEPENLGRVFDPFFSTKPTGRGIGLGLTVARKIVELHGGQMAIKNRAGHGTEVVITLKCLAGAPIPAP